MLDPDLIVLIRHSIRSIWALELLLLLKRRAPAAVARDALVQELRATPTLIDRCISQLEAAGLVTREDDGPVRYAPTPGLADLCDRLAAEAASRPVMVRDAFVSAPVDNLRNFADAFRFKNENPKKDGDT